MDGNSSSEKQKTKGQKGADRALFLKGKPQPGLEQRQSRSRKGMQRQAELRKAGRRQKMCSTHPLLLLHPRIFSFVQNPFFLYHSQLWQV